MLSTATAWPDASSAGTPLGGLRGRGAAALPARRVSHRSPFEVFEQGPLRGAETAFSLDFEAQRQHIDTVGSIRYVVIAPTPFFGPLVISACLMTDGIVELVGVIEDDDYWDLIDNDPTD